MRWNQPLWWPFNFVLFLYHLINLGAAKILGHVLSSLYFVWEGCPGPYDFKHDNSSLCRMADLFSPFAGITWKEIWEGAQICHIRLIIGLDGCNAICISFTAPKAKIEYWSMATIERSEGHFTYLEPLFRISDSEACCLIEAAQRVVNNPIRRIYDYFQLIFGFIVNLIIWIFWWPAWGKEVIKLFNIPGGSEVCSTGTASLLIENIKAMARAFLPFVIAMVSPAVIYINRNWRKAS